jgi:CubicO group peptidase (beta-lactamase class C family)
VDFSAAATLDTDYGAGFWTNRSEHQRAKGRVQMGIPRDAFFAFGYLGQRIMILPSQHMVIVRLGPLRRSLRRYDRFRTAGEGSDCGGAELINVCWTRRTL